MVSAISPYRNVEGIIPHGQQPAIQRSFRDKICKVCLCVLLFFRKFIVGIVKTIGMIVLSVTVITVGICAAVARLRNCIPNLRIGQRLPNLPRPPVPQPIDPEAAAEPIQVLSVIPESISPEAPLTDKLVHFKRFPIDSTQYLQRIVNIHRAILRGEDPESRFLNAFNAQIRERDPNIFLVLLILAAKGMIFAESPVLRRSFPDFLRSSYGRINDIRIKFWALPENEKAIIFNTVDPDRIDEFEISENGKTILRELKAVANQLVQGNPSFFGAVEALV